MILLTGASGKTGKAILSQLAARGVAVRALIHRAEQAAEIFALGATEALTVDLCNPTSLAAACKGVRAVYSISPNMSPNEIEINTSLISAAHANGIEQFVYHSVLHPQTEEMPHHWSKLRVEELLLKSGLPFTIIQPCAYMQNIQGYWEQISTQGIYPVPYAVQARLSLVDLNDLAEAVAIVLTEPGHMGATYELVGTPPLSQEEVAEELSHALKRDVRAVAVGRDEWEAAARKNGMETYAIQTLLKMFIYYEKYGLWGSPHTLHGLLGRSPTSLDSFLERIQK